jgi:hypothetical protein
MQNPQPLQKSLIIFVAILEGPPFTPTPTPQPFSFLRGRGKGQGEGVISLKILSASICENLRPNYFNAILSLTVSRGQGKKLKIDRKVFKSRFRHGGNPPQNGLDIFPFPCKLLYRPAC